MKVIKNRAGVTLVEVIASAFVIGISLIVVGFVLKVGMMKYRELRAFDDLQTNAFRILVNLEKGGASTNNPTMFDREDFSGFEYSDYSAVVPRFGLMYAAKYELSTSRMLKAYYQIPEGNQAYEGNSSFAEFQFKPNAYDSGTITMRSRLVKQVGNTIQILGTQTEKVLFPFDDRNKGIEASGSAYAEIDEEITESAEMQDNLRYKVYDFIIEDCRFELVSFDGSNVYPGGADVAGVQHHDGVRVTLTCLYRYPTLNPFDTQLRTRRVQFQKIISRRI